MMKKFLIAGVAMIVVAGALTACTNTRPGGLGQPQLTFEQLPQIPLDVGSVDFLLNYNPGADPRDISSRFVISPHEALRRYTARRFAPMGGGGRLKVMVDVASVHMREIPQKNKTLAWADIGTEDEYEVDVTYQLQPVSYDGQEGTLMQWKFHRTLVMPKSVSLAEREKKQIAFLEKLIADVDASAVPALKGPLNLAR